MIELVTEGKHAQRGAWLLKGIQYTNSIVKHILHGSVSDNVQEIS